jgi:hypothetical protein
LAHCPDFAIVDEAHTCSNSSVDGSSQQQRYRLIEEISQRAQRHLVLLSATPHSGIETGFLSLISLLKPEFSKIDFDNFSLSQRVELAKYFVQRRRGDIKQWLGAETPFPDRDATEISYKLSKPYQQLYDEVYDFARNLVKTTDGLSQARQQGRYWAALAILRCVMSSPAAAIATLSKQVEKRTIANVEEIDDELMSTYVYDRTEQEQSSDAPPPIEIQAQDGERRHLKQFLKDAEAILPKDDRKLQATIEWVKERLSEGLNPIVWCRYIATAKYVAKALDGELAKKKSSPVRIIAITGEQSEDEREDRLVELTTYSQRVMVATDCLSEGVNLQTHFQAAIHYDLPWNPNRLEQREGRIDRYGQTAPVVKTSLLYGSDNKIDLAVLEVLIRKAVSIRKTLGITVPIPIDSTNIQTAIFKSLFEQPITSPQLTLDLFPSDSAVAEVHSRWDKAIDREKQSRTKFAQASIKPVEIETELQAANRILGSSEDVERFVRTACERLGSALKREISPTSLGKGGKGAGRVPIWVMATAPDCLRSIVGDKPLQMTFQSSPIDGVEYIGRNHPIVERLAGFLLEETLTDKLHPTAARCGYVITDRVKVRTNLFLLRLRHLIGDLDAGGTSTPPLMAEECIVAGFTGSPSNPQWLSPEAALELLATATPKANANDGIKQREVADLLDRYGELSPDLEVLARERADELAATYARVRMITKGKRSTVHPQMPMDLLGLLILTPG